MPLQVLWTHSMHCEHRMGVSANTTTADCTGVLPRFLEDILVITKDQELGLLHVDMEPVTFHASLPCLELGDTLLFGGHDEHQVISVKELPCYASAELALQNLHHKNEEQWAKDRTLMHTNSYTKLLTVLTIDSHKTPGLGVHALDDRHSPFLHPRLLKAHHRTFLGTWLKAFSRSTKAK